MLKISIILLLTGTVYRTVILKLFVIAAHLTISTFDGIQKNDEFKVY